MPNQNFQYQIIQGRIQLFSRKAPPPPLNSMTSSHMQTKSAVSYRELKCFTNL